MEYPIIDTLTNAYIRNGWTGLELTEGKNLFNESDLYHGYYNPSMPSDLIQNEQYRTIIINTLLPGFYTVSISLNNIKVLRYYIDDTNSDIFLDANIYTFECTTPSKFMLCFRKEPTSDFTEDFTVQVERGTQATPYEPYFPPYTDIFSRTRLPIIRHYPYALIDALQRASTGTQTADDTEVLRHYLTPLGIGGI